MEMASMICPRECLCSLKWRERRMRRFDRRWSISSFFNTPRACNAFTRTGGRKVEPLTSRRVDLAAVK